MSKRQSTKQQKTTKAIQALDTEELGEVMKGLVANLLTGKRLENYKVSIELQVPQPIWHIINSACEATGADINEVFAQMASEGLTNKLNGLINSGLEEAEELDDEEDEEPKSTPSPDSDLAKQFAGIQQFATQLKEITKVMEALNGPDIGAALDLGSKIPKDSK
jgi:hypothetical protein